MSTESRRVIQMELDRLQYDRVKTQERISELQAFVSRLDALITVKQA
jgi:hypothetical protein